MKYILSLLKQHENWKILENDKSIHESLGIKFTNILYFKEIVCDYIIIFVNQLI